MMMLTPQPCGAQRAFATRPSCSCAYTHSSAARRAPPFRRSLNHGLQAEVSATINPVHRPLYPSHSKQDHTNMKPLEFNAPAPEAPAPNNSLTASDALSAPPKPFHLNLNVDDLGHTVIVGRPGSGMSALIFAQCDHRPYREAGEALREAHTELRGPIARLQASKE